MTEGRNVTQQVTGEVLKVRKGAMFLVVAEVLYMVLYVLPHTPHLNVGQLARVTHSLFLSCR